MQMFYIWICVIAKRLKEAGFNDAQAEAVTTVFRDVRTADLANLATKTDI